jgi:hypothetical protein
MLGGDFAERKALSLIAGKVFADGGYDIGLKSTSWL